MSVELSIIIATYNSEKTLVRTLESIGRLKFKNWECVVVDGGSKDKTLEILNEYSIKESRIKYHSEPDKGIYDAFNKGWKRAEGKWIYYLGSDDIVLPGLQRLLLNSCEADIVYGNNYTLSHNGKRLLPVKYQFFSSFYGRMVSHQALIMRRECIEKLGGFDTTYKLIADFDLIQRAYSNKMRFRYVDSFVSVFSSDGATGKGLTNLIENRKISIKYKFRTVNEANFYFLYKLIEKYYRKYVKYPIMEFLLCVFPNRFGYFGNFTEL